MTASLVPWAAANVRAHAAVLRWFALALRPGTTAALCASVTHAFGDMVEAEQLRGAGWLALGLAAVPVGVAVLRTAAAGPRPGRGGAWSSDA